MIGQETIDHWFKYHTPTVGQISAYGEIREAAKRFAEVVNQHVPDCADKTAAMRKIRESVMAANLAVACYVEPVAALLQNAGQQAISK
jgi:hypothetical protein